MEIIGFTAIFLVMVVVIIRRQYIKNKMKTQKNLEIAANQLQLQIEEVADTVISRMENRIDHLEMLIDEADDKINQLDDKLRTLQNKEEEHVLRAEQGAVSRVVGVEKTMSRQMLQKDSVPKDEIQEPLARSLSKTNRIVLELLAGGSTLDEVAKRTGLGKGAILLIRELYKSK